MFTGTFLFANTKNTTTGPSIALRMQSQLDYNNSSIHFTFSIKNTGNETLTNIYITNELYSQYTDVNIYNSNGSIPLVPIASLAPGQEDTVSFYGDKIFNCPGDYSQTEVHAKTALGTEIIDLSSWRSNYDNDDQGTSTEINEIYNISCFATYQDSNNNNIVDIGDVVNYFYDIFGANFYDFTFLLNDTNAIISNPNINSNSLYSSGIHYITQSDIDLGYVANYPYLVQTSACGFYYGYPLNFSCDNCPTPLNCSDCIVTKITDLFPNRISGNVKFNSNNNNCATGVNYPNRLVKTATATETYGSFTNANGNYNIYIPNSGSFDTNVLNGLGSGVSSSPINVIQDSSGENITYTENFCISSSTNLSDLSVDLIPIDHAQPGFDSNYRLHYVNNGTTSLNGSIQLTFNNGKLSFVSANPSATTTTSNTLSWTFSNLLPYQNKDVNIIFNAFTPPTVNQDDIITFTATGTTNETDANTVDNTFVLNQTVVNSFDPNDKTVLEGATITATQATQPLHYITRFQNTGTYPANTVVIRETLDADLDWNTFEPIGASNYNKYRIQIKNGNEVAITFDAINLPNSSANEPQSNGWFSYKIKPKSTFTIGNIANSSSDIYFDYNLPIITNTVTTQINALSSNEFDINNFKIYPNPANNYFVIQSNINKESTYEIVGVNGKILSNGNIENMKPIDISALAKGFYFVTIKTQNAKQTYKIIKN